MREYRSNYCGYNLSVQFAKGVFNQAITSGDHLCLEKTADGKYFSVGSFTAENHSYGGEVEFLDYFRTTANIPFSTKIIAEVQSSDDNLIINDFIILVLGNGVNVDDISSLASARYT